MYNRGQAALARRDQAQKDAAKKAQQEQREAEKQSRFSGSKRVADTAEIVDRLHQPVWRLEFGEDVDADSSPLARATSPRSRRAAQTEQRFNPVLHAQLHVSEHDWLDQLHDVGGWKGQVAERQRLRDEAEMEAIRARALPDSVVRRTLAADGLDQRRLEQHLERMSDQSNSHARHKAQVRQELSERAKVKQMQKVGLRKVKEKSVANRLYDPGWVNQQTSPRDFHDSYRSTSAEAASPTMKTEPMVRSLVKTVATLAQKLAPPQRLVELVDEEGGSAIGAWVETSPRQRIATVFDS